MSYLQTVLDKLEEMMRTRGLTDAHREEIRTFFREKVLESFRNGVEKGTSRAKAKRAPKAASPTRRAATGR